MAIETVYLLIGQAWSLVSAAATGPFQAEQSSGGDLIFFFGDTAPVDGAYGVVSKSISFASLSTKVWVRTLKAPGRARVVRTVDAANLAELLLGKIGLSATSFSASIDAGVEIATITGRTAGDKIESISPNDGRFIISSDGTKILKGMSAVTAGKVELDIEMTHPLAPNSPRRTKIEVTIAPSAGGGVVVPASTVAPSISGTPQVGQTLTGNDGTWTNSPTSFNRVWRRNGSTIAGAFGSTYTTVAADGGQTITFASAGVNSAGAGLVAVSAGLSIIANVLRAMGQGDYMTVNTVGIGAANRGLETRLLRRAQARTASMSVVFGVYKQNTNPIKDVQAFSLPAKFAELFEPNPVLGVAGLGPAYPFLFSGAKFRSYDPVAEAGMWIFESDELPIADIMGRYLEAGEVWGGVTGVMIDADGSNTQGNNFPRNRPLTNYIQRYCSAITPSTDTIGDGTGTFYSRTSRSAAGAARVGSSQGYVPLYHKARVPKTMISLWTKGDSTGQDQKTGYGADPLLFDVMGDADANCSFPRIGAKRLGIMHADDSRGSDGDKWLADVTNWPGRLQATVNSGCTCLDLNTGLNDYNSLGLPGGRTASETGITFGSIRKNGSNVYMAVQDAIGAAGAGAGPAGSVLGATEIDGGVTWACLGPLAGTDADISYTVFGFRAKAVKILRDAFTAAGKVVPTIRIMTPMVRGGSSTDGFTSVAGQTPGATTKLKRDKSRDLYYNDTLRALLKADAVIDVTLGTETAVNSGIIRMGGASNNVSYVDATDLVHPLDIGQQALADLYPMPPAVTVAQLAGN